jgi:hypothetical protein
MSAIVLLQDKIQQIAPDLTILEDSGWDKGRSGGRCITDFSRNVKFSRLLTKEELKQVCEIMASAHCPGWTGVFGRNKENETVYNFSTTWDSSD